MDESKNVQQTSIAKAKGIEEIADFWDSHSLDDYWEQTQEVEFEVRMKKRRRVTIAPDIYDQIETQARSRGIMAETLVNLWLVERLQKTG